MDLTRSSFGKKAVYGRKRGHYGRGLKYNKHKPVDRKAILREIARENRGNPSFGKFDNWNNQKSIGQVIEQLEQNPFDTAAGRDPAVLKVYNDLSERDRQNRESGSMWADENEISMRFSD